MDEVPFGDIIEHTQTQELSKLVTFNGVVIHSDILDDVAYVGHRDVDDANVFHQYKVTKLKNVDGIVTIEGVHVFFDEMLAYGFIDNEQLTDATAHTALSTILNGSRWEIGVNQCSRSSTELFNYVSRLEAFWLFVEKWKVEFKFRMVFSNGVIIGRYIDIYDQLSQDYGKWYEYGDQLLTVEKEEDRQMVFTALVGIGKSGQTTDKLTFKDVVWTTPTNPVNKPLNQKYVELPSATALYGFSDGTPRTGFVEFSDIEDAELLLERTYEALLETCRPYVQFKAVAYESGLSELGEWVTIVRDDLGIRYKTRVFKIKRNFMDATDKEFEFGDKLIYSQGERSVQLKKELKAQEAQTISWMEVMNSALNSIFWNEDGYNYEMKADNAYDLPGGYYSFNAPIDQNPTKCIYMGAGMLAIANEKNLDGSWKFRTWATGDGFTADLINAGTVKGTNMEHDLESGVSLYSHPTTGDNLVLHQGELYYQNGTNTRHIKFHEEGIVLIPGTSNTGTAGNTGLILIGKDGSHKYVDFYNEDLDSTQRIVGINETIRVHIKEIFEVRGNTHFNGSDVYKPCRAKSFKVGDALEGIWVNSNNFTVLDGYNGVSLVARGTSYLDVYVGGVEVYAPLYMNGYAIWDESDTKLKKNVVSSTFDAISETKKQKVIEFEWKEDLPHNKRKPKGKQLGLSAQDSGILQVSHVKDGETYLGVDMTKEIHLATLTNQQLIAKMEEMEARLLVLENQKKK